MSNNKQNSSNKGCQKAILAVFCVIAIIVVGYVTYCKVRHNQYLKNPPCASREYVQAFAGGVEFPPYGMMEYKYMPATFLPDFMDTVLLRFDEMPDSIFYNKLDSLCNIELTDSFIDENGIKCQNSIWLWHYYDESGEWYYWFPFGCSRGAYPEYRQSLIDNGLPESVLTGHDLIYAIDIPRDSQDWMIIYGES